MRWYFCSAGSTHPIEIHKSYVGWNLSIWNFFCFKLLQKIVSQSIDCLTEDDKKDECAKDLQDHLNAIILHAKQVAESPRTGDNAGQRLLCCTDEAKMALQRLFDVAGRRVRQSR